MIPDKKKTPEEIAALREELGIPGAPENTASQSPAPPRTEPEPKQPEKVKPKPAPVLDPAHPDATPSPSGADPVVHLDLPPATAPEKKPEAIKTHSLRKNELPLAPAPTVTRKTTLPTHRHDPRDIAEIRRREAIASLAEKPQDPAIHLKKITAHPVLLAPAYLLAFAAAFAAWHRAFYAAPLVLISLSILLTVYIFICKKRSRHHAAILTIIIVMTLTFGGLHYAPLLLNYGP